MDSEDNEWRTGQGDELVDNGGEGGGGEGEGGGGGGGRGRGEGGGGRGGRWWGEVEVQVGGTGVGVAQSCSELLRAAPCQCTWSGGFVLS